MESPPIFYFEEKHWKTLSKMAFEIKDKFRSQL